MEGKSNDLYKVLVGIAAPVGLLALALACSSPSSADAQAALCSNLTAFQQSVDRLTNLNSYSSMGELKEATNDVRASFQAVSQSNATVKNAQVDTLTNAYDDLRGAIDDLPDETSIQDAASSLQPQIAAVQSARQQVRSGVDCP
jgi:hypothetical protein